MHNLLRKPKAATIIFTIIPFCYFCTLLFYFLFAWCTGIGFWDFLAHSTLINISGRPKRRYKTWDERVWAFLIHISGGGGSFLLRKIHQSIGVVIFFFFPSMSLLMHRCFFVLF